MTSAPLRVLLVEDDRAVRQAIESVLCRNGYEVESSADGAQAVEAVDRFRPDVAILDIALPGDLDGFRVGRHIRSGADIPIIFLTASESLDTTLAAFAIGADDYITKPFSTAELMARMDAVLRRSGRNPRTIRLRDVVIDPGAGQAWRAGTVLDLTATELRLLVALAKRPGQTVSKMQLLVEVWQFGAYSPNLVEVHVSALRRKLEALGSRLIFTERGEGYVLRP